MEAEPASPMLPVHRTEKALLEQQNSKLAAESTVIALLDAIPALVFLLNSDRSIIFANKALCDYFSLEDSSTLLGLRPGEVLHCIHALESDYGCGTTEYCRVCGAAKALKCALTGRNAKEDCRVLRETEDGFEALDLLVDAKPITLAGEECVIFTIQNTASEKRRRALEKIFFHDVLNSAGALSGFAKLLKEAEPEEIEELVETIDSLSQRVIDEIAAQRDLLAAEGGELKVKTSPIALEDFIHQVINHFIALNESRNKRVDVVAPSNMLIESDKVLLGRVLSNMLKNAFEASRGGDVITMGFQPMGDRVRFFVKNPAVMPVEIQRQMFQRSFSTKGTGRGIGTYSMKLLGERYLGGKVWFESTPEVGTCFYIEIPLSIRPE
ncbi:MAG: PAS domain-containing sensor histidine kinase [Planctomycetota bacterium]